MCYEEGCFYIWNPKFSHIPQQFNWLLVNIIHALNEFTLGINFSNGLRRLNRFMDEWSTTLGHGSAYGFLEPQFIHNAKDRREECQHYNET